MRGLVRFGFLLVVLLLISPFVISSLLIDQRGVSIPGRLTAKDERIVVQYASWTRKLGVTVEYDPPDGAGVAVLETELPPDEFDHLKKGDPIPLRYLREADLPAFPGARTMRQMHVLPTVRLANRNAWSGFAEAAGAHRFVLTAVLCAAVVLLVWRLFRIPLFGWAVGACVTAALAISLLAEFPKPMPPPKSEVRTTTGTIKSLERWEWLFRNAHNRGVQAEQPIQVAGVEFVPEGRTEPVVAVDLIDEGSVPGLREHASVGVEYEAARPRVAYVRGATRHFSERNMAGLVTNGIASLAVVICLFIVGYLLRAAYRKLVRRSL